MTPWKVDKERKMPLRYTDPLVKRLMFVRHRVIGAGPSTPNGSTGGVLPPPVYPGAVGGTPGGVPNPIPAPPTDPNLPPTGGVPGPNDGIGGGYPIPAPPVDGAPNGGVPNPSLPPPAPFHPTHPLDIYPIPGHAPTPPPGVTPPPPGSYNPAQFYRHTGHPAYAAALWRSHHPHAVRAGQIPGWVLRAEAAQLQAAHQAAAAQALPVS